MSDQQDMIQLEMKLSMIACHDIPLELSQYEGCENLIIDMQGGMTEYQEALQLNSTRKNFNLFNTIKLYK